ncbi:MAG: metalloregulator ArsR/SmtB family transcription factor [Steroidobacteraceae bacterium]
MDTKLAVTALAALAQEHRLAAYRELVQAGPAGVPAGELAERIGIPANTLSFHVKALSHAGLVESRHEGRYVYYSASFEAMNALLDYLSDNCCGGRPCKPTAVPARKRRTS